MEQCFNCDFCEKIMGTICPDCNVDDFYCVKCPNRHKFHSKCIMEWAMYESYCTECKEELIDVKCNNIFHMGKINPYISNYQED